MSTLSLSWRDARFSSWIGCEFIELWRYTILAGDFFEDGSGKGTQRQGRFAARRRSTTASAGCWWFVLGWVGALTSPNQSKRRQRVGLKVLATAKIFANDYLGSGGRVFKNAGVCFRSMELKSRIALQTFLCLLPRNCPFNVYLSRQEEGSKCELRTEFGHTICLHISCDSTV